MRRPLLPNSTPKAQITGATDYADVARLLIRHDDETIDHRVMLAQLRQAGVSRDVFELVQGSLCLPDRRSTGKGMVAGGAISPLLGGLYLTPLDRAMEGLCQKGWIRTQRYMDDTVIFASTRHTLKAAIKRLYAVLETLKLTIHPDQRDIGKTVRRSPR